MTSIHEVIIEYKTVLQGIHYFWGRIALTTRRNDCNAGFVASCRHAIAPGFIPDTKFWGTGVSEERRKAVVSQTPSGRVGVPDDIANAVLYLASPEASFITGEVLNANGGWLFGR